MSLPAFNELYDACEDWNYKLCIEVYDHAIKRPPVSGRIGISIRSNDKIICCEEQHSPGRPGLDVLAEKAWIFLEQQGFFNNLSGQD